MSSTRRPVRFARKSSTGSVRSPPLPPERTVAPRAISAAWRSPRGASAEASAQRFPPTVACARTSRSARCRAAVASGSSPSSSAETGVAAPIVTVPPFLVIPSRPARARRSARFGRSRPAITSGITIVPPPTTVTPVPSPNAASASSGEVGTTTSTSARATASDSPVVAVRVSNTRHAPQVSYPSGHRQASSEGGTMAVVATAEERRDALVGRLFEATLGAFDLMGVYLGDRLGLYRTLSDHGPCTSSELAEAAGIHERYAREWLEQQAMGEILGVENPEAEAGDRRYHLLEGHDEALLDETSLNFVAPMAQLLLACTRPIDALLEAFRTGAGVPYADYGADLHEGQARFTRPMFDNLLTQEWIPA